MVAASSLLTLIVGAGLIACGLLVRKVFAG